jgi:hypothetical protein
MWSVAGDWLWAAAVARRRVKARAGLRMGLIVSPTRGNSGQGKYTFSQARVKSRF